jgi:hypothetical protein
MGARAVVRIPFGYAPEIHFPENDDGVPQRYRTDIAYLGVAGPLQRRWLRAIGDWRPSPYGVGWQPRSKVRKMGDLFSRSPRLLPGYGTELRTVCSGAKIIFNMIRAQHGCAHSMKTFEIPACGGFHLCNRTDEQLEFFPEGTACEYYSTVEELIDKVEFYLSHDAERRRIAAASMAECQQHSYDERARSLIRFLDDL